MELLSRSSSSFFALFLVVVEKFYQVQTSNFSHIFVIRTEPEPFYKITHKWCFSETSKNLTARFRYSSNS